MKFEAGIETSEAGIETSGLVAEQVAEWKEEIILFIPLFSKAREIAVIKNLI